MLRLNYVYRPGMELLAGLSFGATFVVGGWWLATGEAPLFLSGTLTTGTFVTFLLMSQRFVTPLAEVSTIIDQYENARASSERVFGLMSIPATITDADDATALRDPSGEVTYEDVTFGYDEEVGDRRRLVRGRPRRDHRARRADGRGEVHAPQTPAAALRRGRGLDSARRPRYSRPDPRLAPEGDRLRRPGHLPLRRHHRREPPVRGVRRQRGRDGGGREGRRVTRVHHRPPGGLRHPRRRARGQTLRRPAPAPRHRAGDAPGPAGARARRGDFGCRHRDGGRNPALARTPHRGPHDVRDRPPTLDRDQRRPSVRPRRGRVREAGSHDELLDAEGSYARLWRAQSGDREALREELADD